MSPDAQTVHKLLYISDFATNAVYVYNYETGATVGALTGFQMPEGQCVDKIGDVWITNYSGFSVTEYAHGGTAPINTLSTVGYALGCSIDPTTGNLAVASEPGSSGSAVIQVWQKASGSPNDYSNSNCQYQGAPGYDNNGNLYVEGSSPGRFGSNVVVCELPAGGTSLNVVSFDHSIGAIGSVMWDGRYITLADGNDDGSTAIYQATEGPSGGLSAVSATILTDTPLCSASVGIGTYIVGTKNIGNVNQATAVVGESNGFCPAYTFLEWSYPAGGNPVSALNSAPEEPAGESVSIVPPALHAKARTKDLGRR